MSKLRVFVGVVLVGWPLVGLFVLFAHDMGLRWTIDMFGGTALVIVSIAAGAILVEDSL